MADTTPSGSPSATYRRWTILAFLVFLVCLSLIVAGKRQALGDLGFLKDDAYLNLAVCEQWGQTGVYGVDGHAIPATHDVLWRALITSCNWLCNNLLTAPYLLGALFGLVALSVTMAMAWRLQTRVGTNLLAALLMIVGSSLLADAVAGRGGTLTTALCAGAFLVHLRGLERGRSPLPLGATLLVGLAALVHIEFLVVWIALVLHALLLSLFRRPGEDGFLYTLIRALTGAVLLAILLAPLIWWNTKVIGVPWPRVAQAPLTLDAWGGSSAALAWSRMQTLTREGLAGGFGQLQGVAFLQGWPERIMAWLGMAVVLVEAVRNPARRPLTGLLALVLVPVAFAPLYPYVGWTYAGDVFCALQPVWIVLAAFGVARLASGLTWLLDRGMPACPPAARTIAPLLLVGALLVFNAVARTSHGLRVGRDEWRRAQDTRRAAHEQLTARGAGASDVLVTDRPGWLLREKVGHVVDLTGAVSPLVLAYLDPQGAWDLPGLSGYLQSENAGWMVIWSPSQQPLADALGCPDSGDAWPRVCRITWP